MRRISTDFRIARRGISRAELARLMGIRRRAAGETLRQQSLLREAGETEILPVGRGEYRLSGAESSGRELTASPAGPIRREFVSLEN